jgi:N-acetylmuramoyl-L-alanine amidase
MNFSPADVLIISLLVLVLSQTDVSNKLKKNLRVPQGVQHPAIILEVGYYSHEEDRCRITAATNQKNIDEVNYKSLSK